MHTDISLSPKRQKVTYYPNTQVKVPAHKIRSFQQEVYGPRLQPKLKRISDPGYAPDDKFNPAVKPKNRIQERSEKAHEVSQHFLAVEKEVKETKQELGSVVAENFEQAIMRKEKIYAAIMKREAASISPIRLLPHQ